MDDYIEKGFIGILVLVMLPFLILLLPFYGVYLLAEFIEGKVK